MAESNDLVIRYTAEATAQKFHASEAFVRGLMGPIGSGKSVACVKEMFRLANLERPQQDGVKRSRWAVIRNTYPELKTTTLQTYLDWFGEISTVKMNSPIEVVTELPEIGLRLELYFIALDRPDDIKKLKSLELTGAFINEASEIPKAVLEMATGRVGRYPAKRVGGPRRPCVILDTNPPDDDHWWYLLFEEEQPEGYELFKQPPALLKIDRPGKTPVYVPNPEAENIVNLPDGYRYYLRQIPGKKAEWIKVFVMGQYGTSESGRPCYPAYKDDVHLAKQPLQPIEGVPLLLGWDYGRTPACIIGQMTPRGQLRALDEICVDHEGVGMGIRKFTRDVVKPFLDTHYPGYSVLSWGDPAGGRGQHVEETCYELQAAEGIPTEPALGNAIDYRLENVDYFLLRMADGEPGLLISPTCKTLRKGFNGGYQFERVQVTGDVRYKDQPKKNRYSHPHDAFQYLADLARHGIVKIQDRAVAQPISEGVRAAGWT